MLGKTPATADKRTSQLTVANLALIGMNTKLRTMKVQIASREGTITNLSPVELYYMYIVSHTGRLPCR